MAWGPPTSKPIEGKRFEEDLGIRYFRYDGHRKPAPVHVDEELPYVGMSGHIYIL